jgi:hypothetical protein
MTSVFYSEYARNSALSNNLAFQAQPYIAPLDFLRTVHLPSPTGALTTIPGGPYATSVDVSSAAREGMYTKQMQAASKSSDMKIVGIVALLAAFYIFLPQRA